MKRKHYTARGKKVLNRLDYKQIPRINRVYQNMYFLKNDRKKEDERKEENVERERANIK